MIWEIIAVVAAYFIGAIPFGFLIGKAHGIDIRKVGSGNIGATNVTRSVGAIAGKCCFALDLLKGFSPTLAVTLLFPCEPHAAIFAGAAAIAGHMFPVYLGFKGGKGVSTAAGVALALAPLPLVSALAIWVIVFLVSRYVSLASIAAAISLMGLAPLFRGLGWGSDNARSWWTIGFFAIISLLAIIRHKSNIVRLCNGTENRFERKHHEESSVK